MDEHSHDVGDGFQNCVFDFCGNLVRCLQRTASGFGTWLCPPRAVTIAWAATIP